MNVKLLRKVKRHILEEPKRFDMDYALRRSAESPCGTVGCIAGWAAILNGDVQLDGPLISGWDEIKNIASSALDIPAYPTPTIFYEHNWPAELFNAFTSARTRGRRAKIAAQAIEHFIRTKGKE